MTSKFSIFTVLAFSIILVAGFSLAGTLPPVYGAAHESFYVGEPEPYTGALPVYTACVVTDTVLLIQDNFPWSNITDPLGANVAELKSLGVNFCIINSGQIGTTDLSQFDFIKISAAQNQGFYDTLFPAGTIRGDISTYVQNGGVVSANLADRASGPGAGGNWDGDTFVGGVTHTFSGSNDDTIVAATHPIITGLFGGTNTGQILDAGTRNHLDGWGFASHGFFSNLPGGTTTILSQTGGADIIEYSFGTGTVIATLTTTEFRYDGAFGGQPNEKKLLANELGYQNALGSNIAPVAEDDGPGAGFETDENTLLELLYANFVLSNDTDENGDELTVTDVANPATGSASIDDNSTPDPTDDKIVYNPNGQFEALDTGDSDTDTMVYTVDDNQPGSIDTATITVTITGVNDPPDAVDDTPNFSEDAGDTAINFLGNDNDPDDPLDLTAINQAGITVVGSITVSFAADTISYNPSGAFESLDIGDTDTTQSFTYTLTDDDTDTDTATVFITIDGVNDPPDAVDDTPNFSEDAGDTAINFLGNDNDPDDPLDLTAVNSAGITKGILTVSLAADTISYNPNGAFETLDSGQLDVTQSFTYTLTDDNMASDTATVSITIEGVNDAPILSITGPNPVDFVEAGTGYADAGATATDVEDDFNGRALTIVPTSTVDQENPDTYTVTYDVTDNDPTVADRLSDQEIRTVIVRDTTAPLIFVDVDQRDEADETTGTADFSITVTGTDAPRATLPEVTCTDEGPVNVIDGVVGGTTVVVNYGKGVQTINCSADDLSAATAEDPTDDTDNVVGAPFDLAVAEVHITEICVTGVSSTEPLDAEDCTAVDPIGASPATVTQDAKWLVVDLVTIRGTAWGYETTGAASLIADWGTIDTAQDTLTNIQLNGGGDEDAGASFTLTHNYAKAASNNVEPIKLTLENTLVATSNLNVEVSVNKRATSLATTIDSANAQWDNVLFLTSILTDTDGSVGIPDETITYDNVGVATTTTTQSLPTGAGGTTGSQALQAGPASVSGGAVDAVDSHFATTQFYELADDIDTDFSTTIAHNTGTLTTIDASSLPVIWDGVFSLETTSTDNDIVRVAADLAPALAAANFASGGNTGSLETSTITYSGPGVAGEDDQSHTLGAQVDDAASTGTVPVQAGPASTSSVLSDVKGTLVATDAYNTSMDATPLITPARHNTETSLDPLVSLVAGTSFTPSGFVIDLQRVLQDDSDIRTALGCNPSPLVEACPNFVNFDTGSFTGEVVRLEGTGLFDENGDPILTFLSATLQGVSVDDPLGGFTQFGGVDVLQLFDGGRLITATGAIVGDEDGVILDIRNLNVGDTATFTVTTSNPDDGTFEVIVEGADQPNFVSQLFTEESGISEIVFTPSEDDVTDVQISAIRIANPEGDPPIFFEVDFSTLPDNELVLVDGKATFISGGFKDIIVTPADEDTNLTVQAFFDQTDQYNESESAIEEFDTLFQSWGVGGLNVAIAPDSGTGFTSIACAADVDGDALCDNWEMDEHITYNLGGGVTANWEFPTTTRPNNVITPGPDKDHKDIYLEVDYMGPASGLSTDLGHKMSDLNIFDMVKKYQAAPISNTVGGTGINLHIEISDKIPHVAELNVWTDDDNDLTNDFNSIKSRFFGNPDERVTLGPQTTDITNVDANTNKLIISGTTITIPSNIEKSRGTITMQARVVFSGDPGTVTHGQAIRSVSPNSAAFFTAAGFIGETFTQDFSQPNAYIFTITQPFSDSDAAVNKSNFVTGTMTLTIDTTNNVSVVTTAGTTGTYRNSPIVTTSLLDSKAQAVHYVLIVHSIGECGPSGVAEFIGNDMIISLGCNFSSPETGIARNDANGNANTAGSRWEFDGTFMHELGHNLGLAHGGGDTINCKPNYESVMSYARQTPVFLGIPFPVQYSSGLLPTLNENAGLEEFEGLQRPGAHGKIVFAGAGGSARITTTSHADDRIGIDWNDVGGVDADNVLTSADINNFEINGCGASPNQSLSDFDDWNNLVYNFRGAGGSAFDGWKEDPRKRAEVTERLVTELEGTLDWYTGIEQPVPREGSTEENAIGFKIGSTIPLKFKLFSCNPALLLCVDENDLAGNGAEVPTGAEGEEIMTEFTDLDKVIFVRVKKFAGSSGVAGTEVSAESGGASSGFFRYDTLGKHFIFNWDTKQLLDSGAKGKAKKANLAEAAGTYALRFIELQDGVEVGFMLDRFEENNIKIFEQRLPSDLDILSPNPDFDPELPPGPDNLEFLNESDELPDDDADELVTVILELTP